MPTVTFAAIRTTGIPFYGIYDYTTPSAPNELEGNCLVKQLKRLSRYVINIRGVRHLMPDSADRFANGGQMVAQEEDRSITDARDVEIGGPSPSSRVNDVRMAKETIQTRNNDIQL